MYITQQGDTFDIIAKSRLGGEKYIKELILANPEYANTIIFSDGINLNIPDVNAEETAASTAPWR